MDSNSFLKTSKMDSDCEENQEKTSFSSGKAELSFSAFRSVMAVVKTESSETENCSSTADSVKYETFGAADFRKRSSPSSRMVQSVSKKLCFDDSEEVNTDSKHGLKMEIFENPPVLVSSENTVCEMSKSSSLQGSKNSEDVKVEYFGKPGTSHYEVLKTDPVKKEDFSFSNLVENEVLDECEKPIHIGLKSSLDFSAKSEDAKHSSFGLHYAHGFAKTELLHVSAAKAEENSTKASIPVDQLVCTTPSTVERSFGIPRRGRRVPFITLSTPGRKGEKSNQTKTDAPNQFSGNLECDVQSTCGKQRTHFGNQEGIFRPPLIEQRFDLSTVNKERSSELPIMSKGEHSVACPEQTEISLKNSGTAESSPASAPEQVLSHDQEQLSSPDFQPKCVDSVNQGLKDAEGSVDKQCDPAHQTSGDGVTSCEASKLDELAEIAASVPSIETRETSESKVGGTESSSVLSTEISGPSHRNRPKRLVESRKSARLVKDRNSVLKGGECAAVAGGSREVCVDSRAADSRKRKFSSSSNEVEDILNDMDDDIDNLLEATAQKNKLTRTNVKNILRHVMTNDYVLTMVRKTMEPGEENAGVENPAYEPKLTRSKVKELREKKGQLPWLVSTPSKQSNNTGTIKLLQEEFSDHDSTSDEEYKPNEEEECHSEEEENSSDVKTAGDADPASPTKVSPKKNQPPDVLEETQLVIAESLDNAVSNDTNEADKIALRTRSKLPLNDTPLETIEASFVAPDITVDMYNTECDDEEWKQFLCDFTRPMDTKVLEDQPDDAEDDPEYNVLEEEDLFDEFDIAYDKDLKIPRKELKALMRELLQAAEQEYLALEEEEDSEFHPVPSACPVKEHVVCQTENTFQMLSRSMSDNEKLQLQEQMRMHVQLLCQTYLVSKDNPFFANFGYCAKDMLVELKALADRELPGGKVSYFNAANLDGAVEIVHEFALDDGGADPPLISKLRKTVGIRSVRAKKTMALNQTFIYPDLLPFCSFRRHIDSMKTIFTLAEDNLIALGLEQFSDMQRHIHLIHEYLLPTKTEQQIRFRIKNTKRMKHCVDHPIQYYYTHWKCPPFPRTVRPFDPNDIKVPAEMPPETMPKWMRPFLARQYVPLAPIPVKPPVVKQPVLSTPEKRHYSPILPRGSPMKQVIPILRKYGQHRRSIILTSPTKRIPRFTKKPARSPLRITAKRKILPKISNNDTITPNVQVSCIDNISIEPPCSKRVRIDKSGPGNDSSVSECKENSYSDQSALDLAMSGSEEPCSHDSAVESESQNEMETCEEGEDEALDDEQDLAALMVASSTICKKQQPVVRKKNRHQKDVESTLALLSPDLMESDPKKAQREACFAQSYLLRVLEVLKTDPERLERFLVTVLKFEDKENSVVTLFGEIEDILKGYSSLMYDFIGFLSPEQAKECGKYLEYLTFTKIRSFLRKIEVHFSQQPQQIQKIIRALGQLNQQPDLTSETVMRTMQTLLRNQSHLLEEFSQLLPDDPPPESLMTDFEEITIPDSDADCSSADSFEDIIIPETADPYGGKDCPCSCHIESSDVRMQNRSRHCAKCGTKFLDGKVYIQTGKVLKPAQVIYHSTIELQSSPKEVVPSSKANCKTRRELDSPSSSPICSPHPSQSVDESPQLAENQKITSSKQKASCGLGPNPVGVRKASLGLTSVAPSSHTSSGAPASNKSLSPKKTLQRALEDHLDDVSGTTLPCPVIEDAVLPPDSSSRLSSVPSDFSHLKDVIRSSSHSPKKNANECEEVKIPVKASSCESFSGPVMYCIDSDMHKEAKKDSTIKVQSANVCPSDVFLSGCQVDASKEGSGLGYKTTCQSTSSAASQPCETSLGFKWTRDEDTVILTTCKERGISDETFSVISQSIKGKNIDQIKNRLEELLRLFKMKTKGNAEAEG